jgi:hypothetical protein
MFRFGGSLMSDPLTFDEATRHYVFLTAAWIANVDGRERDEEIDALCQLRKALDIAPGIARQLRELARGTAATPPALCVVG